MKIASIEYRPHLKTKATHIASDTVIQTAAPIDNQGDGSSFSPTDLLSTSLATCMFTLMGIKSRESGFDLQGANADVEKLMKSNPRRVGVIRVMISVKGQYSNEEKSILEEAARNCPVAKSLHPEIHQDITFEYTSS